MALSRLTLLAASAAVFVCGAAAHAATHGTHHAARSPMQQDRSSCAQVEQASRAACNREMAAAAQAARNGGLTHPGDNTYERNAMARCDVFKSQADKSDCQARMSASPASGSVEGGGVLREATTMVPAKR